MNIYAFFYNLINNSIRLKENLPKFKDAYAFQFRRITASGRGSFKTLDGFFKIVRQPAGICISVLRLWPAIMLFMSTYILMKILESAPHRYDLGIRMLTLGKLDRAYDRLMSHIKEGQRVLDIGCGTGALTLKAARKGAVVKGIDVNSQMLEIAKKRAMDVNLVQNIKLCEMGIAELGSEKPESYDVVMSGLTFSELTEDELNYTLKEIKRILKSGGILLVADEIMSGSISKRILNLLIRLPLAVITFLITQTTTKALKNLPGKIEETGFKIESVKFNNMENFIELAGRKPAAEKR